MSKFDMFESRKEIRLDSTRVKRKLLVIKTSNQQRKIETRLDLPAVGFGFEKNPPTPYLTFVLFWQITNRDHYKASRGH